MQNRPKGGIQKYRIKFQSAFINKLGKALLGQKTEFKTLFTVPGHPWQNAYVESFNSCLRNELLNVEIFSTLAKARVLGNGRRR